ncbi:unnamed protein product, partial [Laminaria digitata]
MPGCTRVSTLVYTRVIRVPPNTIPTVNNTSYVPLDRDSFMLSGSFSAAPNTSYHTRVYPQVPTTIPEFTRVSIRGCVCVFFTLNRSSTRRHPAHPVSVLVLHPREIRGRTYRYQCGFTIHVTAPQYH